MFLTHDYIAPCPFSAAAEDPRYVVPADDRAGRFSHPTSYTASPLYAGKPRPGADPGLLGGIASARSDALSTTRAVVNGEDVGNFVAVTVVRPPASGRGSGPDYDTHSEQWAIDHAAFGLGPTPAPLQQRQQQHQRQQPAVRLPGSVDSASTKSSIAAPRAHGDARSSYGAARPPLGRQQQAEVSRPGDGGALRPRPADDPSASQQAGVARGRTTVKAAGAGGGGVFADRPRASVATVDGEVFGSDAGSRYSG